MITETTSISLVDLSISTIMRYGKNNYNHSEYSMSLARHRVASALHASGFPHYHHMKDPDEFTNLADKPGLAPIKERLVKWLPKESAPAISNK